MRTSINRIVLALAFAATQGCADPVDAPQPSQSDVQIELAMSPAIANHESVLVDVTIVNASANPMQLLSWYLPSADLQEPVFQVTRDGQPVRYIGAHYKRAQPDSSDFVALAPGGQLHYVVDLSRFYDFSQTGDYTVQVAIDDGKLRAHSGVLASTSAAVWVEGRAAVQEKRPGGSCTSTQQSQIAQATTVAGQYAAAARDYLGGSASATPRYTTWFGSFSTGGWNTARTHFTAIASAFATQTITVDCSCRQKNVYAYVYPDQPYNIYVCGAFWSAPASGTDSKAGTLVHEMSHFNVVAATDDFAYGQTACKALAQSNPSQALNNADSHEYFAENTPALP